MGRLPKAKLCSQIGLKFYTVILGDLVEVLFLNSNWNRKLATHGASAPRENGTKVTTQYFQYFFSK